MVNGTQFFIYGDSGYSTREFMEVPYQVSRLSGTQTDINRAMSRVRVTVELFFK